MLPDAIAAQVHPTNMISHSALTGQDPIRAFQSWLDEALRQVVLGGNGSWLLPYVRDAADVGVLHARVTTKVQDADFDEDKHPRDKDGKWTSGDAPQIKGMRTDIDAGDPAIFNKRAKMDDEGMITVSGPPVYPALRVISRKTGQVAGVLVGKQGDAHGDVASAHGVDSELVAGGIRHKQGDIDYERGFVQKDPLSGLKPTVGSTRKTRYYKADDVNLDTATLEHRSKYAAIDADTTPQDRTHLLQSLAITELQGIIEATSQQLVRAFTQGILSRTPMTRIAVTLRTVVDQVGVQRGRLLVSFMCVRAFNAAALDGFRARGITHVGLIPERTPAPRIVGDAKPKSKKGKGGGYSKKGMVGVLTAEDDRVCPVCEEIAADGPYYIDEAEALIPAHPRCRCAFVPADEQEREDVLGDADFDEDKHPRDKDGQFTVAHAIKRLHALPEVTGGGRHFDPSFGGEDYGPEVTVRSAGFERTPESWITKKVSGHELKDVPLSAVVINQSAATKGLVEKYIRTPPSEPVDFVEHEGKFYATSGTHRLVAKKMLGATTIHGRVFKMKGKIKDSVTHIAAGVMITADNTGRTLFLRRSGTGDAAGTWAFPAGAVEPGETVEQGAARETREEIGYDPSDDMEQAHRAETSGVDFTTFMHTTEREFRPLLNNEHDAYKWALVEGAPEPLHPGVARTLDEMDQALRMRDESNFDPELHPRDKDGKFAEKGGLVDPIHPSNLMAKIKGDPFLGKNAYNFQVEKTSNGGWEISGKDIGHWVNPPDEEDEEDYDHQIPTPDTEVKLANLVHGYAQQHGLKASISGGEKNYSYIKLSTVAKPAEPTPAPKPATAKSKIEDPQEATTLEKVLGKNDVDVLHYTPAETGTNSHVFSVPNEHADKAAVVLENYDYTKLNAGNSTKFAIPATYTSKSTSAPAPKPDAPHVAAEQPAENPSKKYLSSVKGNTPERIEMRAKMKTAKGDELKELQARHNASLWKQYQKYESKGDTAKQAEFAAHLAKFSKSYGLPNPLSQPTSKAAAPAAIKSEPKLDFNKPSDNFEQMLKNHGVEYTKDPLTQTTTFLIKSKHETVEEGHKYHGPDVQKISKHEYVAMNSKSVEPAPKPFGKAAPLPSHQPEIAFASLKKVGEQKGSNPGGVYEDAHGQQYYVKTMDEAHAKNELLAAKLYALAGSPTLNYVPIKPDGDVHYVATKYEKLDQNNVSQFSPSQKAQAQAHLATHAWLANWDAAGTGGDNQGAKDGIVKTLDVGGALEYRAKGTPKGAAFGTEVGELKSLRDGPSVDNNKLFGSMTNEQIKASVAKVNAVSDVEIMHAVRAAYGDTPKTLELTNKLVSRKNNLVASADTLGKAPPAPDLSHMSEEDQRLHWLAKTTGEKDNSDHMTVSATKMEKIKAMGVTPAELGFIRAFTGPASGVNAQMRDGHMDEHVFAFKHIMNEALDKFPVYKGDTLWRKINLTAAQQAAYVPGKIAHWQAFSSTAKNPDVWSGNTHFTIRNPKSGRDVQFISENPNEAEVIMPADTYYRTLSKKVSGGTTHIELEEVLPFGKKKQKAA
jgi:8-oxo-dGTP pyrophosphatase MutT (NUDIX family)